MNYETFLATAVDRLRDEQRYRMFVDLERIAGRFPYADVIAAMIAATASFGAGAGGTRCPIPR
ncbi:hypothetical protein [Bradyrhizobium sp. ARR65]|uniref:hypothetical protein n=1 Tax=Bradyrhizobium sp. ARR65 TaxID=1040989 RepID=UPI0004674778|nr:hypothetical protein [Bradyrhizobium sp. ARR65]